jgi:ankyrin repeat protein
MTDKNLDLSPEEKSALQQDKLMMEIVKEMNSPSQASIASLFPNAIQMSTLGYWSAIARPDAAAHLKQAIAAGDNVNEHNGDGYTALHAAAENGCIDNVKLLLANGADVAIRTTDGKFAVDLARLQGHTGIVSLFEPGATTQHEKPWWKFWQR